LPSRACADEVAFQKAVLITGASTGIGRNAAEIDVFFDAWATREGKAAE